MRSLSLPAGRPIALAWLVCAAGLASPARAQIPDRFTNLKVLPKHISKHDLVGIMRGWASDLGVRCAHCHMGPDNLQGMDFASDKKATKRAAREMARMVRRITSVTLAALPNRGEPRERVQCVTCHRGAARPPLPMNEELVRAVRSGGVEAATRRYRELRRQHRDDGQYNFGSRTFSIATSRLAEAGKIDEAVGLARLGVAELPDVAGAYVVLGNRLLDKGDREGASAALRRALALDPTNEGARWGLRRLQH